MTASCPLPSTSEPSREEQARALCLRLLTATARTRAELAGQLAKRGYPDDVSTRVLDGLADAGLIDDTTSPNSGCTRGWRTQGKASARWLLSCEPRASTTT